MGPRTAKSHRMMVARPCALTLSQARHAPEQRPSQSCRWCCTCVPKLDPKLPPFRMRSPNMGPFIQRARSTSASHPRRAPSSVANWYAMIGVAQYDARNHLRRRLRKSQEGRPGRVGGQAQDTDPRGQDKKGLDVASKHTTHGDVRLLTRAQWQAGATRGCGSDDVDTCASLESGRSLSSYSA